MTICDVNGCNKKSIGNRKTCSSHSPRCSVIFEDGSICTRAVYASSNKCIKCTGKIKICSENNCNTYARSGTTKCGLHTEMCKEDGCITAGVHKGYCSKHYIKLICNYDGCNKVRRNKIIPFCARHGGGHRCEYPDCKKIAQNNELNMCLKHFKNFYYQPNIIINNINI